MPEKKIIAVIGRHGRAGRRARARDPRRPRGGRSSARAITRKPDSDKARALAALGVEVVAGDADDPPSLERAFAGAYGAFCVTNFWEHFSAEREGAQATAMARATRQGRRAARRLVDARGHAQVGAARRHRMPTLQGKYKVPALRRQGRGGSTSSPTEAAPTTYLLAAFYWENFIHFGMGPRKAAGRGRSCSRCRSGGAKLPGIAAEDIGKCAYGVFRRGTGTVGQRFGIAGEVLSGRRDGGEDGARARAQGRLRRRAVRRLSRARVSRRGGPGQHVPVPGHPRRRVPAQPRRRALARARIRRCWTSTPGSRANIGRIPDRRMTPVYHGAPPTQTTASSATNTQMSAKCFGRPRSRTERVGSAGS